MLVIFNLVFQKVYIISHPGNRFCVRCLNRGSDHSKVLKHDTVNELFKEGTDLHKGE